MPHNAIHEGAEPDQEPFSRSFVIHPSASCARARASETLGSTSGDARRRLGGDAGWRAVQVHRESTAAQAETHLRNHVYPPHRPPTARKHRTLRSSGCDQACVARPGAQHDRGRLRLGAQHLQGRSHREEDLRQPLHQHQAVDCTPSTHRHSRSRGCRSADLKASMSGTAPSWCWVPEPACA
jgi:hypothetical protein